MISRITTILVLSITLLFITSCGSKTQTPSATEASDATIKVLELETYKSQLAAQEGAYHFVDVRTPEEVAEGQIPGAVNIDYKNADFKEKVSKLDSSQPIYLYCRSGNRSGKASKILVDLGFKEIYDLEGGWIAYLAGE